MTFLLSSIRFRSGCEKKKTSPKQNWKYLNNIPPPLPPPPLNPHFQPGMQKKKSNGRWKNTSQYECKWQDMSATEARRDNIYIYIYIKCKNTDIHKETLSGVVKVSVKLFAFQI